MNLSHYTEAFDSATHNNRIELGIGLRSTRAIQKNRRLLTNSCRTAFDQTLYEQGRMVQDTDKRYGYIVGGALVYAINSADAKDTKLTSGQRRLRANVSFVRVKCSHRWVLAIETQRLLAPLQELVADDYLEPQ
jgi:hypothetical protein